MSDHLVKNDYDSFLDSKKNCRLPRWNELPELELYMDQVITLMNKYIGDFFPDNDSQLTPSMINNYVKHCIIPSPVKKKYNRTHLSRLLIICALKSAMPISSIAELTDRLLVNRTDEQLHDFFAMHYENTFRRSIDTLREYAREVSIENDNIDEMLSLTILNAASISCAGKFLASNALNEQEKRLYGEAGK